MKYREVARKLKALGCQELPRRGGGSHRKWLTLNQILPDRKTSSEVVHKIRSGRRTRVWTSEFVAHEVYYRVRKVTQLLERGDRPLIIPLFT